MRARNISACGAIAMLLLSVASLSAHPGGHGREASDPQASRTWTLTEGTHLHGTFESAKEGNVQIRRENDSLVTLSIDRLIPADRTWIADRLAEIKRINTVKEVLSAAQKQVSTQIEPERKPSNQAPAMLAHFQPFEKSLKLSWDREFLFVGSNGMPNHRMMVGITAWQQQVPLPQKYFGENAWRIPLHPVPAKDPAMIKGRFLRGAIALAVNGIPIFNPQNNRGEVSYEIGELDEFGGHCGRADDYHYHLAPVHLEKIVGPNQPIAYALDGYPIYGYQDEKSPDFAPLDRLSGHKDKNGAYHYHATKAYPYVIGGFYGEVVEREGQVDPQPRAEPVRPALQQLREAKITEFVETKPGSYRLTYELHGKQGTVSYTPANDGSAKFEFVEPSGKTASETYTPRSRGPGGNPASKNDRPPPPPRPGEKPAPKNEEPSPRRDEPQTTLSKLPKLKLSSSSLDDKGFLKIECTCDGKSESPAISWNDAPAGTKSFAVSLWHTAPDQEKSYWLVYNIPAESRELKQNGRGVGTLGLNGKRRAEYDPMCSKGPGVKTYHISVFALSSDLKLPAEKATRAALLEAIKDITLAEATLDFQYERKK